MGKYLDMLWMEERKPNGHRNAHLYPCTLKAEMGLRVQGHPELLCISKLEGKRKTNKNGVSIRYGDLKTAIQTTMIVSLTKIHTGCWSYE